MKLFIYTTIIILTSTLFLLAQNNQPSTVDNVDLKKYTGLWYEISKIPNSFQDDCYKNTTASYKIREDGKIEVLNRCVEKDGEVNDAKGVARVVDKKTRSKLEVSFVSILGINLFWGDYWIIGLDKDYNWAVIGHPERKYGWILCRTSKMPEEDLKEAYDVLRKNGYNPDKFVMTKQD